MWRILLAGSYEPTDWRDIEDLRERWHGPIIVKGCVSADDALVAAGIGIDAVQMSNHGGRQLDHMAAPLDVLPEIVDGPHGRMEIIVDGGIRRGTEWSRPSRSGLTPAPSAGPTSTAWRPQGRPAWRTSSTCFAPKSPER